MVSDDADEVVLLDLEVLSEISKRESVGAGTDRDYFQQFVNSLLELFRNDQKYVILIHVRGEKRLPVPDFDLVPFCVVVATITLYFALQAARETRLVHHSSALRAAPGGGHLSNHGNPP